jgi:signal transduction histidine kinase
MEALGRLAGGVAHDFNNVLHAVKGGVALASKRVRRDPDGALRYLDLAADATERGAAVTGRLLSFARPGELSVAPIEPATAASGPRVAERITRRPMAASPEAAPQSGRAAFGRKLTGGFRG